MSNLIDSLVSGSPIKPLQSHMALSLACVETLGEFLVAANQGNWQQATAYQQKIKQLENDADSQKRAIRQGLTSKLLMPFSRADAISLLTMQDKLANKAKDVAGIMLGREMAIPAAIAEQFLNHYRACSNTALMAKRDIDELDNLLETGFAEREFKLIADLVEELDALEEGCDEQEISLRKSLLDIEDSLSPVNVVFLYRVIQLIGEIADIAERIGNRLIVLVAN